MVLQANAWTYHSHQVSTPTADLPWQPGRRNSPTYTSWPPTGVRLSVRLLAPTSSTQQLSGLNVTLVYELYDGAPILSKWLEVSAAAGTPPILLGGLTTEVLALNCEFSPSSKAAGTGYKQNAQMSRFEVMQTVAYGVNSEHTGGQWTVSANLTNNDPGACEPVYASSYVGGDGNMSASPHPTLPILLAHGPNVRVGDPATALSDALVTPYFVSARTVLLLHDSLEPTRQMLGAPPLTHSIQIFFRDGVFATLHHFILLCGCFVGKRGNISEVV